MRTALIAALAALSAAALAAPPAFAQRNDDRGSYGRGGGQRPEGERRARGDGERQRGDRGDQSRRGGDGDQNAQARQAWRAQPRADVAQPPVERNRRGEWSGRGGGGGEGLAGGPRQIDPRVLAERGARGDNGRRDGGRDGWRGDNGRGDGGRDAWRGDAGRRGDGGRESWRGDNGRSGADNTRRDGGRESWRGDNGRSGADNTRRDGGREGWRGDDGRRDAWRGGGGDGAGRDGDWRRDGDGRRDGDWRRDGDGRRDWAHNDWNRDTRRDDDRYRRWRHTHRDFDRPRYRDWRHVRHGYYFDRGYALIVAGFFGHNYYWWGYDGWRRPYRHWAVGYVLPAWIYWEPVPYDLYYRLPPAPYGCRYILVDRDILLIVVSTGLILDALMYY
jgi:hypothetical protein